MQKLISTLKTFSPGPAPVSPIPGETAELKALRLTNLWRRWTEWGSPFAAAPGTLDESAKVSISGSGDTPQIRVITALTRTLQIRSLPDVEWLYVRRLAIDPFKPPAWQTHPWPLEAARVYEFRMFSRDQSAPRREDVKALLGHMGFAPMKLSLLKRNIRLPGRPTSLSLWYGMGQWLHPRSIVTIDDPFYFEEVREVIP